MKSRLRKFTLGWQLLTVFACAAAVMLTVEIAKVALFSRSLSLWQSHLVTILATAICVTAISYFVRKVERTADIALLKSDEQLMRSEAKSILSTLTAGVSHELNSPIGNSIIAATSLSDQVCKFRQAMTDRSLKRSDLSATCSNVEIGAAMIERNLTRAQALLKCFSQVSANQASEQRRRFDLDQIIQDVLFMLGPSLSRSPHKVVTHIPVGITMESQPGSLEQVIINLVNNAWLHAFEKHRTGILIIGAESLGDKVMLTISDNGVGMDEETVGKMFQPFFSTKIGRGGTGLGMAIVENLVKKLDGEITVQSKRGEGTCFTLTLPQTMQPSVDFAEVENANRI
jgi:signal transduction histidine kinase